MKAEIKLKDKEIVKMFEKMTSQAKNIRAVLARNIYPIYQNAQRQRWMTEGSSEGHTWKALTNKYATYKKSRYGGGPMHKWVGGAQPWMVIGNWMNYPGSGTKLMIATGRLHKAMIGPSPDHKRLIGDKSMTITITVPYAKHANAARDFTTFSADTKEKMRKAVKDYMKGAMKK